MTDNQPPHFPASAQLPPERLTDTADRVTVFNARAAFQVRRPPPGYQRLLAREYRYHIPPGQRVLEIGCGVGDLLAAVEPACGVGIDFSPAMVQAARERHPDPRLQFLEQSAETFSLPTAEPFDYVIISDTLSFVDDILQVFRRLSPCLHAWTRIVINFHSHLWRPWLRVAEWLGWRFPHRSRNWVTTQDVTNLLELAGYEVVSRESRLMFPFVVPGLSFLFNRILAPTPGFNLFALTNWVIARQPVTLPEETSVSVICACRNESGNIPEIVRRLPAFPGPSELIFVEGHSRDDTLAECQRQAVANPERDIRVFQQTGRGKGDAVRLGFAEARYDIVLILDADMTVPPEDLPEFVRVLTSGRAEFVNGSRLLYPMEEAAMRFLNLLGNKAFALGFSFLLGQAVKDTLCGTKVLLRRDYERIAAGRSYFGDFDPFGDFDLIFGAAKLSLRMRDFPVRYRARTFGETQISRFRHGWLLIQMFCFAMTRLKWR